MASTTEVIINGRAYRLTCDSGQEAHLATLADMVDQRIRGLLKQAPHIGETMALVLSSLMLADELYDCRESKGLPNAVRRPVHTDAEMETAVTAALHQIAERIEAVAEYAALK